MGASSEQLILGRCHALDARQGPLLPFLVAIFLQGGHQGYWQSLSPLGDARQQVWQGPARRQLPRRVASQALFGVAGRLCAQAGWQAERRREATNGLGEGAMCGQGCSAKGVPHCHPSLLCSLGEDRAQPSPRGASTSALAAQSPGLPGSCSPWSPDGGTTWTPSQHPQARGSEPLTPQGWVRARDGVWLTIAAAAERLARPPGDLEVAGSRSAEPFIPEATPGESPRVPAGGAPGCISSSLPVGLSPAQVGHAPHPSPTRRAPTPGSTCTGSRDTLLQPASPIHLVCVHGLGLLIWVVGQGR